MVRKELGISPDQSPIPRICSHALNNDRLGLKATVKILRSLSHALLNLFAGREAQASSVSSSDGAYLRQPNIECFSAQFRSCSYHGRFPNNSVFLSDAIHPSEASSWGNQRTSGNNWTNSSSKFVIRLLKKGGGT